MVENRKTRYTKRVIRESLQELLEEKPLSSITVKELVERADINRSTFYAHYETLPALIEEIERETAEQIIEKMAIDTYSEADFKQRVISDFVDLLVAHRELGFWLWDEQISGAGEKYLHDYSEKLFVPLWVANRGISEAAAQYHFEYIYDGCFGMLKRWFREPDSVSPDEFKQIFRTITEHMLSLVH